MYRLLLLLEGILFVNVPYKDYILIGLLISFIMVYIKKFWGFTVYLITLLWLSNLLTVENMFSLKMIYATIYLLFPAILYLDALLKKDFNFDVKLLGIFSIPLLLYPLLDILSIDKDVPLTLTYVLLLIYGVYLNFKSDVPKINNLIKIFAGVSIPLFTLYLFYMSFPDVLSYPRSQISVLLGLVGLYLLIYKIRSIND
ncbi:hypothetical protein CFE53_01020 [Methanofervidicoccus sp. A16]|uniref:hypothetical protein n=1 Tax=Methanofervidicoccus sp. A16 TaxID=2607662 RepID=UPI00118C5A02|nr:hypothetical protein [Methanofervidicoccus sp. A16]AXI24818.1 hypothetical protein CFE53_01020 [Methanofervidicoccus sp. A16]MBW9220539.1 hypothetical protein [Methanothermococcus sp. SCGC AD-155-N22]HIQ38568.1 hypothetical protein [Methanothermococcus okinawensis]